MIDGTNIIAGTLLSFGAFFCIAAVIGVLRFPDLYTRLHAVTKGVTAGALFLLSGVAVLDGLGTSTIRLLLIGLFFLATNPVASHAIARAARRQEVCRPQVIVDDYEAYLETVREETPTHDYPPDEWPDEVEREVAAGGERDGGDRN